MPLLKEGFLRKISFGCFFLAEKLNVHDLDLHDSETSRRRLTVHCLEAGPYCQSNFQSMLEISEPVLKNLAVRFKSINDPFIDTTSRACKL